ncbi:MAG: AsmA family protein [candidate division NC10 bacterium]|nr:AsmA family protein [candidate division NC10 bacterium]
MKRILWIGVVFLVLIVGGLVFLYLSLNRVIRSAVETYGPQVTKSEVKLGSVNVSPFSGAASLSNLVVGNPQGFKTPSAFKLGAMSMSLDVRSLLSDTVAIREIVIRAPEITYELGPGGNNLAALQKNVEAYARAGGKSGSGTQAQGAGKKVTIDRLRVEKSKLNVSAGVPLQTQTATLELPDIEMKDIGKGGQGASMAAVVEKVLEEISRNATKAVANVDVKGLAEKAGKGAGKEATGAAGKALKGVLGK